MPVTYLPQTVDIDEDGASSAVYHSLDMANAVKRKHQKPAHTSDTYTAEIEQLSYDGRGVAHVDGKAVFIDGALPGERVVFRYGKRHKRYDTGQVLELLRAAPTRVPPECRYFGTCGGCSLQHLAPEAQLAAKQQILADSLAHIGKVAPERWLAPLSGPVWAYRRKARLGVRLVPKKGGVLVGFRERRHSFITPLADCKTLDQRLAKLLPALTDLISTLSCANRIPQIEAAAGDHDVALVFRHLVALNDSDRERLRSFGERHAVQIHVQAEGPESVTALWPLQPPLLSYRLAEHDVEILFAPTEFVQVNTVANACILNRALELLDPQTDESVLDLFSGVGNFTLPLARRAARVLGVEGDATLVQRARLNATHNRVANASFRQADLYRSLDHAPWDEERFDKLLLDPPRSGAIEAIKHLQAHRPSRIVYVSCYPATLARDSDYLVHALGYRMMSAGVADMFPQTSHTEAIALFVDM
jgi:23S rRNA (uracil1939-C5)-methyltransferase